MSNDTQHYSNYEIFHSLTPKLKAAFPHIGNWDEVGKEENYEEYGYIVDIVATAYRSGYGRGQKGRSFLIGEKKVEVKGKKGDKVCWFSDDRDIYYPDKKGIIGTIDYVGTCDTLWVYWPVGSCKVHEQSKQYAETTWCCNKNQCLLIDTNVKGNVKNGDKIVYLGTKQGFLTDSVWPDRVATGVVDYAEDNGCLVFWDNPNVVNDDFNGRTHVWYEDIAKVIPWD